MAQTLEINQVGKREDLRDFISIADVRARPFLAMCPKLEGPKNMLLQWQADEYDAPDGNNSVADGVDVDTFEDKSANRALLQNYAQKFRKTWMVGDIAENISNIAGLSGGEAANSVDHCLEEIARDIETRLGGNGTAQLEVSKATPYRTRGLGGWLQDGTTRASADTVLAIPSAYNIPTASVDSNATPTEAQFKSVLAGQFAQWGKQTTLDLIAGTTLRNTISGYTQTVQSTNFYSSIRTFNQDLNGKKITASITVYEGDFNTVRMHTSLLLPSASYGYLCPMEYMCIAWGRQPRVKQLEDQGGGPRGYVDAIIALVVKNPTVFGVFEG